MPNPPDVVNILFTGVAPTRQEGQNKRAHLYCDRRVATLAREASFVWEWGCWFHVVRKQLRKLKTCNLKRLNEIRFTRNVLSGIDQSKEKLIQLSLRASINAPPRLPVISSGEGWSVWCPTARIQRGTSQAAR